MAPLLSAEDDGAVRLYQANCSYCHGARGEGGRGPDLTVGRYKRGGSDPELFSTIRNGVPGTEMPAVRATDDEVKRLVGYVRNLAAPKVAYTAEGDASAGKSVYDKSGCASCHATGVGPELAAIGLRRETSHLRESIMKPDEEVAIPFRPLAVITKQGASITGMRLNEDDASIQLRDFEGNPRSFLKSNIREIKRGLPTPMPSYSTRLGSKELDDLVAYLATLRDEP